ncbi:MAG TPA: M56 family metallopeptidase [Gemmatimonas sp.]|nr:M56 family metallopeptidase [Gemmatimonas sp.]
MTHDNRGHLVGDTRVREERHRRCVLFTTGVLILLGTSPVLVHHVGSELDQLLAGRDHLWELCVIALHQLLAPVHDVFHVLLVVGLLYATWDRARAWLGLRRVLRTLELRRTVPGDGFWAVAQRVGVPPGLLRIVDGLPNPAFTAGWLRPRIYVARELADVVSPDELGAVLAHEHAHVIRRDPARLSILRFVGCALFWLPALRRLAADVADDAEIAADDAAVHGRPLVLASAILSLAGWRVLGATTAAALAAVSGPRAAVAGFQRDALLDRRIRRLAGEAPAVVSHVTGRSLAAALAGLALVWTSGLAVAHPLPNPTAHHVVHSAVEPHCEHAHQSALSHLFCAAGHDRQPGQPCPHEASRRLPG